MSGFSDDPNYKAWAEAPQVFKDSLMRRLGAYALRLVRYVKSEKLSGQVLGKYQGVYDSVLGQKSGRMQNMTREKGKLRGTLYKQFSAQVYNNPPAIQFFEPFYGKVWEGGPNGEGWSRKAFTVRPRAWRNPGKARLMFYAGGGWHFAKKVFIPAGNFPAKPHIAPSIKETWGGFITDLYEPWAKYMRKRNA